MSKIAITQVKSGVGAPKKIRRTLEALGLRHQRTVVKPDEPAVRGMVFRVRHLVEVAAAAEAGAAGAKKRTRKKPATKPATKRSKG